MIVIDSREPKFILEKIKREGIDFEVKQLEVGDYLLPDGIVIERKAGDFLFSIMSGRLWDQLNNLRQADHPVLVIETKDIWKDMYYSKSRHIDKSFFGALAAIIYSYQIPVLTVQDTKDFVLLLKSLYNKTSKESSPKLYIKKGKTLREIQERLLANIPGISIKKASALLDHFRTIQNIANAEVEELSKIKGIGERLANNIVWVMKDEDKGSN